MMQQFENRLNSSSEDIRATFMAELNLSMMDPEEATVESLANKFEDIALFREFTSREDSVADGTVDLDETYAWGITMKVASRPGARVLCAMTQSCISY